MPKITLKLSKTTGLGKLSFNGKEYNCGGKVGFAYPADTTLSGHKELCHKSREYNNVEMKYSVLWIGQKGVYFHEWSCLENSSGCIHLLAPDAKEFYDSINGGERVVFSWTD